MSNNDDHAPFLVEASTGYAVVYSLFSELFSQAPFYTLFGCDSPTASVTTQGAKYMTFAMSFDGIGASW